MRDEQHWWIKEGYYSFPVGNDGYPHSGSVIQYYRIRKIVDGKPLRQCDVARILHISERSVWAMEHMNEGLDSFHRRMELALLLDIPPVLLKLDASYALRTCEHQRPGQIAKKYRKKKKKENGKVWTQADLAELIGISEKSVQSLENHDSGLDSVSRREFLAKVLGIPPALLGLDASHILKEQTQEPRVPKHVIYNQEEIGKHRLLLSSYWEAHYSDHTSLEDIEQSITALHRMVSSVNRNQQEEIRNLLCRYHQLALDVARDQGNLTTALAHAGLAILVAENLQDNALLAAALYRRGLAQFDVGNLKAASDDLQDALPKVRGAPLRLQGMVYMEAGRFSAHVARGSIEQLKAEKLLDPTQTITYRKEIEDDEHYLKLDRGRFHIGKAATLLALHRLQAALEQLDDADRLTSNKQIRRHAYIDILRAKTYFAQENYDAATNFAISSLQICSMIHSESNITDISKLYSAFVQTSFKNSPHLVQLSLLLQSRK